MAISEIRLGINVDLEPVYKKIERISELYEEIQKIATELANLKIECEVVQQGGED